MNVEDLIADLAKRDIVVTRANESLGVDAPAGVLTDADLTTLQNHKAELLRFFRLSEGLPIDDEAARLLAMEEVDADEVPVCPSCGRFCDVQTGDDAWHCGGCDPLADERRRRTEEWMRRAAVIRYTDSRNG